MDPKHTCSVIKDCTVLSVTGYNFQIHMPLYFFFSEDDFVLANGADPDEMPHSVAFYLGVCCWPKYLFTSIQRGFKRLHAG